MTLSVKNLFEKKLSAMEKPGFILEENSIKPQVVNYCGSIVMMMANCVFGVTIMIKYPSTTDGRGEDQCTINVGET